MVDQIQIKRLILSATELKLLHPEWSQAAIEDYLNILDDFLELAGMVNDQNVPGTADNIATLVGDGTLQDSGVSIADIGSTRRAYFYGRSR